MKRKLFFITLLMLFCSSMFGQQHWTMADNLDYSNTKLIIADIKIEGETPANMEDLEVAAFSNGVLRGVAKPAKVINKYILRLTVHTNFNGEQINFKLYDPSANEGEGKEYDTDYTIKLLSNDQSFGTVVSPVEMNFYSMHWSYINVNDNYMAYPCIIKIDGVEQTNPNLELAAFINNELRGVARPKLEEAINIYIANLKIDGNNGQTISFKLYVPEVGELETDYTAIYDIDYGNGLVTLEFRNNPVAKIVRNEITHYFSSLEAAVEAAQPGETIKLLQDVTLEGTLTIEKSITIDGDGFEIKPDDDTTETYNSAIMVGNSGWGDDHGEVITLNNITFNNWKSKYGVVRAQGVELNMEACEFNENDVSKAAYGVLSLNFADATVKNTIFNKNQDRAIDINYNGDNSNAVVTIDGCTFEENASEGAGIVVRNDGTQLVVKNSKFLNNTVTTTGNAAVLYAGWGTEDQITGCYFYGNNVTTSHATTKRFASAIFCDGCAVTGNAFGVNTATRNGETITTTVAVGAYYGAANISENYWGGSAPVPGENYTVEFTNNNVAVNDYYEEYSEGTLSNKVTLNNVAKAGKYYYESITAAFAAVQDGETVTMLHDVSLSESIKVNNNITLDLNGKTITGTDNETASFALFEVQPSKELTVKDENNTGKITLTATNNRGWNAYSSVISNQRGKLTVNGGTIEHLGGTDMAYGIDNLTNGKGTYAETIINGGTVKSLYRAIRQFLNGIEAQNILTVNGGTIEGANKSIWMQSANANANPGKLTIVEGVTVKGNILLEAEPNATSWPVEVSIVASTLKDGAQVMTEALPSGYELVLENGVYSVYHGVAKIGNNYYDDLSSALKAITSGCTLDILTDITIASDWDCRNTGAKIGVPVTINGNGKTIKFTGKISDGFNHLAAFRFEDHVTVNNLVVDMSEAVAVFQNRFSAISTKADLTVNESKFIGSTTYANSRAIIFGEGGHEDLEIVVNETEFINWKYGVVDNMNGGDVKSVTITDNTFDNADVVISAKEEVTFTGNNMSSNSYVNITSYTVPNNVSVTANDNTNLAANTETEYNQIVAPLAKITAQDGFLTPVAEINGKYFTTLQAAINAAAEDETVKLLADVNYSLDPSTFTAKHGDDDAALFVLADDKLTIDLNGNTISVVATLPEGAATAHSGAIINNGDLTIDDSNGEKEGKVTFKYVGIYDEGYKRHGVVMNLGTLTVNAGTLENVTELQNQQAIDNTNYNKTEVSVVINGGTIKSAGYYAIDMVGYYDIEPALKNSVVINDGTIDGGVYARIQNNTNLSLNITGGVIKSDFAEAVRYRVYYPGNTHSISITGGKFSTTNAESQVVRVQLAEGESLAGFISAGTFSQDVNEFCAAGFMCVENDNGTYGVVVDPDYGMVAKIGETRYATLAAAFAAAAQTEELTTIELLPVTIEEDDDIDTPEKTIKLPATLKNVTVKGVEGAVLKDMTIMAADGNSINYEGITFDGVVFENSCISVTGWRNNGAVVKNFTVTNCVFENLDNTTNVAPVHFNMAATEPVNGFTFTNNVIDGATGGSKSGVYAQVTGETVFTNNVINNVSFRPYVIQLTTDDGIDDNFTVTGNTFSGSAAGRAQGLGNNAEGTDVVKLTVSNNIFKGITDAQQICYWNFNEATTTATLEKNYYDIDVMANPKKIYYNSSAQNITDLSEMGIFPIYTELKGDGTINEESLFNPVAYVGTVAYKTLAEAFADQDGTIVLLENIELTEGVVVAADETFTLDLNGKTITGTPTEAAAFAVIKNSGNLTITDNTEAKEGKIICNHILAPSTGYAVNTITNNGTLTVEAGTIENKSTYTSSNQIGYAIDNNSTTGNAVVTIKDGNVTASGSTYYDGIRQFCNSETLENNVTIEGGEVSTLWIQNPSNDNEKDVKGSFAITGGTLNSLYLEPSANFSGSISGGHVGSISRHQPGDNDIVSFITGGTFGMDVTEFCAFNYVCTQKGDGTYGIVYKPQEEDAFVIETLHELEAFRDAVNAGNNFSGKVFKLKSNIDLNPTRAINIWEPIGTQANPFKGTFDGDNKTISNLVVDGENNVGLFGYATEANIKNVTIVNANVKGTDCVAALIGQGYASTYIDNCHVSGSIKVEGQTNVGGIVGKYYARVTNSSVIGDGVATSCVKGTYEAEDFEGDNIGGIMGHAGENNTHSGNTVKNITISGTRKVGGLIGTTDRATDIDACLVDNVVIGCTADENYANDKASTTTLGGLVGNYYEESTGGTVTNTVVKNVTFNVGNAKNVGPIVGGNRTTPGAESIEGVTASGNLIYMSTITGSTNTYLMNAVAKIGETKYYTLQEAVDASETNETTIDVIANTAETINVQEGANITINNINLTGSILAPNATLKIINGSIVNNNSNVSAIEINAGILNLEGVDISSARHAVRIDGAVTAEVNGGEYTLIPSNGVTQHAFNISGNANVTINGGKFVGPAGTASDSGSAVNVKSGSTVTINGGEFSGGKNHTLSAAGTLIVKGGTFDQVVKGSYLAEGYVCQMNADNKYEVFFAVAQIGETYYETIQEAVEAAENNNEIKLLANIEVTESLVVTKTITLDLNDKTITGTDNNTSGNFYLINVNKGNLTVKDSGTNGTITLVATTERNWSSSSVVIANNQGVLTVDSGTIQHLGGTSMAYAIDNLTNGTIGEATTIINGGNIKSTYFAIRQFANSTSTLNKLVVTGGTIGYTWMQSPNNSVNTAAIEVTGGSITGMCITGVNADLELSVLASALGEDGIYGSMPAGQTLDLTDGVYTLVKAVAQVGENKFGSVIAALNYAIANNEAQVKIVSDSRELMPTDVYLRLNADLEITAEQPYTVKFYNNGTSYDFVVGSYNSNTLTFGENVTFQLEDRIIWLGYYGNDVDVVVNGTLAAKQIWHGANTQVTSTGTIKSTGEAFVMRRGATLTVNGGGTVNASYFNILAGNIDAENANITCGAMWIANTGNYIYEGNVDINIKSSTLTSNGNLKSSTAHADGVSINFENSEVTFVLFDGYGVSDIDANTKLNVKGASANVSIKGLTNNGLVNVTEEAKLTLTGTITNNGAMKLDATSVIYAPENLGVTIDDNDYDVVYESGAYRAVHKPFVAQVEDEQFTSLQGAFEAVQDNGTITLLRDVTFDLTTVGYQDENWVDGVRYNGDKSFTVNFNTYKVTDNGCVNDYLININNKGEKDNEITFTNGTIESANGCWATVCVGAESSTHKTVLNLNDMNIINKNDASYSGNLAVRVRGTADVNTTVNVNTGTTITSDGASYGIAPSTNGAVVNINSGAIIEQKNSGTSGGNSVFAAVGGKGTVNIYDGAIISSDSYGVHTMTTGTPVVNIYGGTITAEVALKASTNGGDGQSSTINVSGGMITGALEEYTDNAQIILTGGTFSTDVNEYCHEYYDAIQGDDNLWRVEQVLFAQTRAFIAGWNWFSSYVDLSQEGGLLKLQTALDKSGLAIKGQTGNQSVQYGKIGVVNGEEIYAWTGNQNWNPYSNKMYMVRTSAPITVEIEGDLIDYENTTIALFQGWNWISYPLSEPAYANEALVGLTPTEGDQIKAYGANTYIEYSEGEWFPYDFVFMPGEGYMYKAERSNSFVYAKGTTNVRATNKTTENNNWIAQTSEYANNMTITAMLSIDGEVVNDNYEIAAFANGECRGSARPIYIEKFDAYILFMTVYGEEVEDLTFRYYDVNYGTEYELDNRVVYSNDASLGSIKDPYMFTLNITGVDETSMSEINIYPNPTTIGSEINLQATCDKVEVFNALGVKVAEYHNVDTLDALKQQVFT